MVVTMFDGSRMRVSVGCDEDVSCAAARAISFAGAPPCRRVAFIWHPELGPGAHLAVDEDGVDRELPFNKTYRRCRGHVAIVPNALLMRPNKPLVAQYIFAIAGGGGEIGGGGAVTIRVRARPRCQTR